MGKAVPCSAHLTRAGAVASAVAYTQASLQRARETVAECEGNLTELAKEPTE